MFVFSLLLFRQHFQTRPRYVYDEMAFFLQYFDVIRFNYRLLFLIVTGMRRYAVMLIVRVCVANVSVYLRTYEVIGYRCLNN